MTDSHTTQRIAPTLSRICDSLKPWPALLGQFQTWAVTCTRELIDAGQQSKGALFVQAELRHAELVELEREISRGIEVTGRTEVLRSCKREYLAALLELVGEEFDFNPADVHDRLAA